MEQLIVKRPMTVDIGDLTEDDIHSSLEPAEVEYVAIKMLQKNKVSGMSFMMEEAKAAASVADEFDDAIDVDITEPILAAKLCIGATKEAKAGSGGSPVGTKKGHGKYHYVTENPNKDGNYVAGTNRVINGVRTKFNFGQSKDPIQCALLADAGIDALELEFPPEKGKVSPRNRDESKEVAIAYKKEK